MRNEIFRFGFLRNAARTLLAIVCSASLAASEPVLQAPSQAQQPPAEGQAAEAAKLPPDQLDSLVAPIALYPDPMLAQVLAASTYPLEIIQLQQWLAKHKDLKDKALADAVAKQPWDPSVQALAGLPDVVKRLAEDIQWTTEIGNAFLAQQSDVMDAVQRMRKKAKDQGNLKSNEQQKVETKVIETKEIIVVEQANPQVVYVPSYNPVVVYGPPVYPYPPIYYPPPGYYAAGMAISFGVGVAMGAMWSGGWGWGCGWGSSNVNINVDNNFNRNTNINGGNRNQVNPQGNRGQGNRGGNNSWQHNPQHRGGTPYGDRNTANKFGGTTRDASVSDRQAQARKNQGNRPQTSNRASQQPSAGNRGGPGASDRSGNRSSGGGGGDRVGNRSTSPGSGSRGGGDALGGGGRTGSSARASSSRGSSSMGSRGGGARGGGGGRRR
ncbi:MAG TPA: DUF3300 domain-containing protein [Candidatus Saccharimonadales bacterium]|nr:DUF3300 domain-containing protein [Candidatus Saccharimonadales bacterium]